MPQNEHIELHRKRHGRRFDHEERTRKREAREPRVRNKSYKLRSCDLKSFKLIFSSLSFIGESQKSEEAAWHQSQAI